MTCILRCMSEKLRNCTFLMDTMIPSQRMNETASIEYSSGPGIRKLVLTEMVVSVSE